MSDATKKAILSIIINSAIAAVSAALTAVITQLQAGWGTEFWFPALFAGLKALQQFVARTFGTGGEVPTKKALL